MTIDDAIKHFGGLRELAEKLGIEPEAIHNWKRRGNVIPKGAQFQIQVLSKNRLKADVEEPKTA